MVRLVHLQLEAVDALLILLAQYRIAVGQWCEAQFAAEGVK
jgi:hypothetical protein